MYYKVLSSYTFNQHRKFLFKLVRLFRKKTNLTARLCIGTWCTSSLFQIPLLKVNKLPILFTSSGMCSVRIYFIRLLSLSLKYLTDSNTNGFLKTYFSESRSSDFLCFYKRCQYLQDLKVLCSVPYQLTAHYYYFDV